MAEYPIAKRDCQPAASSRGAIPHSCRALPARSLAGDVWLTRDGRKLSITEMYRPHLGNAHAVISSWPKREKDPLKHRKLKS